MDNPVNTTPRAGYPGEVTVPAPIDGPKPIVIGKEQNIGTDDQDADDYAGSGSKYSGGASGGKAIV